MRAVLIHASPWKIGACDDASTSRRQMMLNDVDLLSVPLGLLSLHAEASRAGHKVTIFNLSRFPWADIETLISRVDAPLFGLSCFTVNRHGVFALSRLIKSIHPESHIVLGGPFATAFPKKILARCASVDSVAVGEGELTFLDLLACLERGDPPSDVSGLVSRVGSQIVDGGKRARIGDLDLLASPVDRYPSHTIVTSRGCYGRCTFCASEMIWGRKITSYSVPRVLDMLEKLVHHHGLRTIAIKDEVFTSQRSRVIELCEGIQERELLFLWSCDTRVDRVDEELLRAMRLAGCHMVSFGVESGSPRILERLRKKISLKQTLEATEMAKRFGLEVRYFLMYGCPGDRVESIAESIELIEQGKPTSFVFIPFSISPGTEDHRTYVRENGLAYDFYFDGDFLARPRVEAGSEEHRLIMKALGDFKGVRDYWRYHLDDYARIAQLIPESASAHLDLGCAYVNAGLTDDAVAELDRAEDLGFPLRSIILNGRACVAAQQGDIDSAKRALEEAEGLGSFRLVKENLEVLRRWLRQREPHRERTPTLESRYSFAVEDFPVEQPLLPAAIKVW